MPCSPIFSCCLDLPPSTLPGYHLSSEYFLYCGAGQGCPQQGGEVWSRESHRGGEGAGLCQGLVRDCNKCVLCAQRAPLQMGGRACCRAEGLPHRGAAPAHLLLRLLLRLAGGGQRALRALQVASHVAGVPFGLCQLGGNLRRGRDEEGKG